MPKKHNSFSGRLLGAIANTRNTTSPPLYDHSNIPDAVYQRMQAIVQEKHINCTGFGESSVINEGRAGQQVFCLDLLGTDEVTCAAHGGLADGQHAQIRYHERSRTYQQHELHCCGKGVVLEQLGEEKQSHYTLLGVSQDASAEQIRRAYLHKSLECHPDKGGTDEAFQHLQDAYDELRDPAKRKSYDDQLATDDGNGRVTVEAGHGSLPGWGLGGFDQV